MAMALDCFSLHANGCFNAPNTVKLEVKLLMLAATLFSVFASRSI